MNYAYLTAVIGAVLLTTTPTHTANVPARQSDIQDFHKLKTQAEKQIPEASKPLPEFRHPVYRCENRNIEHPVWDGTKPRIMFVNEDVKQFEETGSVLGTMKKGKIPPPSIEAVGGDTNGTDQNR